MRCIVSRNALSSAGVAPIAWLDVVSEIADASVRYAEVDDDGRTAKPRMGLGARAGRRQTAEPRDIGGELQNALVVDVIKHGDARPSTSSGAEAPASYIGSPIGNEEGAFAKARLQNRRTAMRR
jgi:hypothetical protein